MEDEQGCRREERARASRRPGRPASTHPGPSHCVASHGSGCLPWPRGFRPRPSAPTHLYPCGGGLSVDGLPPLTHVLGRLLFYSIHLYPCSPQKSMSSRGAMEHTLGLWSIVASSRPAYRSASSSCGTVQRGGARGGGQGCAEGQGHPAAPADPACMHARTRGPPPQTPSLPFSHHAPFVRTRACATTHPTRTHAHAQPTPSVRARTHLLKDDDGLDRQPVVAKGAERVDALGVALADAKQDDVDLRGQLREGGGGGEGGGGEWVGGRVGGCTFGAAGL